MNVWPLDIVGETDSIWPYENETPSVAAQVPVVVHYKHSWYFNLSLARMLLQYWLGDQQHEPGIGCFFLRWLFKSVLTRVIILKRVLLLVISFLFSFLKDTDSRKGTICPFCVPIHEKKRKKRYLSSPFENISCLKCRYSWFL